ncbi:putative dna topoisomerase iii protein [Eutypa lata UCREL1]|uniref:DNA topoisomerase n=1 Tax=Eutypa lata (strain UCR-EL1) TaxID=1287681 RepID=M7TEL2_EUTLA|nr:putative dna topoisomerase iii protein [Eutypa lata UCREL1]
MKVLCVAEKPSIAKAVAGHLSGGHLTGVEFPPEFKSWQHPPPERLFDAPVKTVVSEDKKKIAENIEKQARYCSALCIWTDCDREGEHIGYEIREAAKKSNNRLEVKRAKFSNIEKAYVDRYFRVQNFKPEPFWSIKVMHKRDSIDVNFSWSRNRLFDRASVIILYERCLAAKTAKVTKVQEKPTKKWKPLPLTTVELQKMATRFLRMTGQQAMEAAESLYNKGFISYPRTETDRFDSGMNLRTLVQKQTPDGRWGQFAQGLVDGGFQQPRQGRNDDKAHPPIHPITYAAASVLNESERKVYEFVVRRFLACCAEDAKGVATDVDLLYGEENFHAHGVVVLERNYLDVYVYEKWTGSVQLPKFTVGEVFEPTEALMTEGKTAAPSYLTEADLIALMDANGIGTDATMAEHIQKIQERDYVQTVPRSGGAGGEEDGASDAPAARGGRGGRGGRGRGRGGRGGGASNGGRTGVMEFIPTKLGVALIEGFDRMNFDTSLGKPFLRKEMELKMRAICDGSTTKQAVLNESIRQYRLVYMQSQEKLAVLKTACREYIFGND